MTSKLTMTVAALSEAAAKRAGNVALPPGELAMASRDYGRMIGTLDGDFELIDASQMVLPDLPERFRITDDMDAKEAARRYAEFLES